MKVVIVMFEDEMETEHAVIKTPFSNYNIFVSSKVLSPGANLSWRRGHQPSSNVLGSFSNIASPLYPNN